MKLSAPLVALTIALTPSLVSAAMFPKDSLVKMLDAKTFKQAMKANETSLVAFVAPWCGHCQRMVPEYSKAALGLYPLIPAYAVDCDAEKNKKLCAQQGVQGFPTVKLFPRGNALPPMLYEQERTASGFWYFATRRVPAVVTKLYRVDEIPSWIRQHKNKHRALLLRKDKKVPLLWQVLGNKYSGTELEFGTHRDKKGKSSVAMGFEAGGKKESKVLLYPAGSDSPIRYEGIHKLDSLSKFFDSVLDGTADLSRVIEQTKNEEYAPDEKELEIEKKQEAQRIALMHGGFTNIIDFEKALKDGAGADFHDQNGYGGMMGDVPGHMKKKKTEETPSMSAENPPLTGQPSTAAPTAMATVAAAEGQCSQPEEASKEASSGAPAEERPKDEL